MERVFVALFGVVLMVSSCAVNKTRYQKRYNEIWREMIRSQAWMESLKQNDEIETTGLYASTEDEVILEAKSDFEENFAFEERYHSLVSRAYFKIITEAEKLDAQIAAQYTLVKNDPNISKRDREEVERKFEAHRAMLSGLRSWNIFSEDRSGDLDYFKGENRVDVQNMMQDAQGTEQMINFLIYKLADLYHVEKEAGN